jgi:molybdenum cofactor synthesis domain-containing protein
MAMYTAWILSIGNELLIGKTVNTNASWLGRKLTLMGYSVRRIVTVPDDEAEVVDVVRDAVRRSITVLVSTGGLGPTFDDRTGEFLAKALGRDYVVNQDALAMVKGTFLSRGLELTEPRLKQARMPSGAEPIPNPVGTAPGIWTREGGTLMMAMFEGYVEPRLREMGPRLHYAEGALLVRGIPEAELAPIIEDAMRIGARVYIKSHPRGYELSTPLVEVHVYSSSEDEGEARRNVDHVLNYLVERVGSRGGELL